MTYRFQPGLVRRPPHSPTRVRPGRQGAGLQRKRLHRAHENPDADPDRQTPLTRSENRPASGKVSVNARTCGVRTNRVARDERPFISTTGSGTSMSTERFTNTGTRSHEERSHVVAIAKQVEGDESMGQSPATSVRRFSAAGGPRAQSCRPWRRSWRALQLRRPAGNVLATATVARAGTAAPAHPCNVRPKISTEGLAPWRRRSLLGQIQPLVTAGIIQPLPDDLLDEIRDEFMLGPGISHP